MNWISVKERLPKAGVEVLLYDAVFKTYYVGFLDISNIVRSEMKWIVDSEMFRVCEFTHWMPLPEPPKEEP